MTKRGEPSSAGPVPVRELLSQRGGSPAQGGEPAPAADMPAERGFDAGGESWLARPAGAGCYGTGRRGAARLMAVHFFRAEAASDPVREALLPASVFAELRPEEWVRVWSEATPIEAAS